MPEVISTGKKTKEEAIDLRETITVYATKKGGHYREGEPFEAHPRLAESLIKDGLATAEAPKAAAPAAPKP